MQPLATVLAFTEQTIYSATGERLSDLQRLILRELWQNTKKTYEQIAIEHNYSGNYIQQVAAPRLWRLLSDVLGQKVTKSNVRRVLEQHLEQHLERTISIANPSIPSLSPPSSEHSPTQWLECPTGSVPLGSPFYISRPQDAQCHQSILQPAALIQIKAPRQMGKTSLMTRILSQAIAAGYPSIVINFQQADRSILCDLSKLLRWICHNISLQLNQEPQLEAYWNEELGHKMSCTMYIQQILKSSPVPIAIAFEEVSELFEHPAIAQDVLTMVRSWHESMKSDQIWQKLRLIVVYATEIAAPLHTNQLPFNVGLEIELSSLTQEQVEDLIQRHDLNLTTDQVTQLIMQTQGNPGAVRSILYRLVRQEIILEDYLK
jgi:hypothetical protein